MYSTRHMTDDEFIQENLTTPAFEDYNVWDAIVADVTSVNDKSADIHWSGKYAGPTVLKSVRVDPNKHESALLVDEYANVGQVSYAAKRKRENFRDCFNIGVDSEQLVFVQENASGKLIRFWLNKNTNVSAHVRYDRRAIVWVVDVYVNHRGESGRWDGNLRAHYTVSRTVTEESELTVAKWVAIEFAKAQAQH